MSAPINSAPQCRSPTSPPWPSTTPSPSAQAPVATGRAGHRHRPLTMAPGRRPRRRPRQAGSRGDRPDSREARRHPAAGRPRLAAAPNRAGTANPGYHERPASQGESRGPPWLPPSPGVGAAPPPVEIMPATTTSERPVAGARLLHTPGPAEGRGGRADSPGPERTRQRDTQLRAQRNANCEAAVAPLS